MSDRFTEQLSPYLDNELDQLTRARLEAHLGECLVCTRALADLRAIVEAAPDYRGEDPARDLWPGIAARLGEAEVLPLRRSAAPSAPAVSRGRFGWPALMAASLAMAVLGGGAVWMTLRAGGGTGSLVGGPGPESVVQASPATAGSAQVTYDAAVRDLEQVLDAGRGKLDSTTVRIIEQNLARIDQAIAESRAAIQQDPANAYLSRQIAANMRRKLNLLRIATNAIAART